MRIYVAGKWQDRAYVKSIMTILENNGHEITCDWTKHDFGVDGVIGDESVYAEEDLNGVRQCEVLLAIVRKEFVYKGLFCEIGAALALYKPVYLLGNNIDSCIFTNHHSIKKVSSIISFLREIK